MWHERLAKILGGILFLFLCCLTISCVGMAGISAKNNDPAGVIMYMVAALASSAALSLASCALCGIAVSLLWPGSVILAGRAFPLAGAWLYAMLAAGGDIGASIGPALLGVIADTASEFPRLQGMLLESGLDAEQFGLRCGMLLGAVFPLGTLILVRLLRRRPELRES